MLTSTVPHDPAVDTATASLIYQTKPLGFVAPVRPTKILTPVPKITVAAFELHTPPAGLAVSNIAEPLPAKSNSSPTPNPSSTDASTTFASDNFSTKITGIVVGAVVLVLLVGLALACWRARRSKVQDSESAPADVAAVLDAKRQRAEYLGVQRWSRCDIQANMHRFQAVRASMAARGAAKEGGVVEAEGEVFEMQEPLVQSRRPSGLAMHPPTPVMSEYKKGDGKDGGRAL
ncbi:uncharacterized protein M421DRAFT_8372 [Didymella exigua CBS 183.55]|uniref:Uncharacterized protein n=1 Tax=Didymella exigua CBS 183.55 TaxID=1150837 RepID=A0A6A5RCK9_9PLEO|nr:uncharacterized protein M421DRAFT_8372 [Didymella exigua CBS 183.55]KAF1924928.1 hypothetical protein M421DRAFT_8372 [Didymella exigua CBS 183.55]